VKPSVAEDRTQGGILLPDQAKEKPQFGKIVAVGEGKTSSDGSLVIPVPFREGEVVYYAKYAGNEIVLGDTKFLLVDADDILGTSR